MRRERRRSGSQLSPTGCAAAASYLLHPIAAFEVPPRVGDDFSVGRMIQGFSTSNLSLELTVVFLHVPEKFELRRRRSNDENGIGTVEGPRDLVEEPRGVIGVLSGLSAPFGMSVDEVLRGQDRRFVDWLRLHVADRLRLDVEDASFLVIDPDDHMRGHNVIFDEHAFGPASASEQIP